MFALKLFFNTIKDSGFLLEESGCIVRSVWMDTPHHPQYHTFISSLFLFPQKSSIVDPVKGLEAFS